MQSIPSRCVAWSFALLLGLAVAACGREGIAQAPAPETELLSRAPISEAVPPLKAAGITFQTSGPIDVALGRAVFGPGASNGWHVHPGPGFVQVKSGAVTRVLGDCSKQTVGAGQAFVDAPGQLMLARNDGKQAAVLFFTFFVPQGVDLSTKRDGPANCPR
jgi:quercetin dioxygenase-like cupin family protein